MLVLSRKCRQSVVVEGCGGDAQVLTVTVLEIHGGRVKLGFDVADDVPILRSEIWEQRQACGRLTQPPLEPRRNGDNKALGTVGG